MTTTTNEKNATAEAVPLSKAQQEMAKAIGHAIAQQWVRQSECRTNERLAGCETEAGVGKGHQARRSTPPSVANDC